MNKLEDNLPGRRFGDGLHQSIEAKEKVEIQSENQTLASITYQNYFKMYIKNFLVVRVLQQQKVKNFMKFTI